MHISGSLLHVDCWVNQSCGSPIGKWLYTLDIQSGKKPRFRRRFWKP